MVVYSSGEWSTNSSHQSKSYYVTVNVFTLYNTGHRNPLVAPAIPCACLNPALRKIPEHKFSEDRDNENHNTAGQAQ